MSPPDPGAETLPLSDLRVVELGNIVAGPFAGSMLADLGADGVKVERPGTGDLIRGSGKTGEAMFAALNRNKRSIELDLKVAAGLSVFFELVDDADVFVENLGRGAPERLGIGSEDLRERNPELVYLSIKGFADGPYGDRAGMDVVAEAMSGLMSVTGEPGRQPVRVGTSIADMGAALYGVIGVFVTLREREHTGEGQHVDGTLFGGPLDGLLDHLRRSHRRKSAEARGEPSLVGTLRCVRGRRRVAVRRRHNRAPLAGALSGAGP